MIFIKTNINKNKNYMILCYILNKEILIQNYKQK
jgi:hypothetical protein